MVGRVRHASYVYVCLFSPVSAEKPAINTLKILQNLFVFGAHYRNSHFRLICIGRQPLNVVNPYCFVGANTKLCAQAHLVDLTLYLQNTASFF